MAARQPLELSSLGSNPRGGAFSYFCISVLSAVYSRHNSYMTEHKLAVIVLAAGQGARMKSAKPKVLHRLAGRELIGHVVASALELNPDHVIAVVRHQRDEVVATLSELMPDILIVDQDDIPGTGRAVEVAVDSLPADFDGDVVVVSGDVPLLDSATLALLLAQHRAQSAAATVLSAILDDATGYGRVVRLS